MHAQPHFIHRTSGLLLVAMRRQAVTTKLPFSNHMYQDFPHFPTRSKPQRSCRGTIHRLSCHITDTNSDIGYSSSKPSLHSQQQRMPTQHNYTNETTERSYGDVLAIGTLNDDGLPASVTAVEDDHDLSGTKELAHVCSFVQRRQRMEDMKEREPHVLCVD
eukprot:Opistho-2@22166